MYVTEGGQQQYAPTTASGAGAHAEGGGTVASGGASHAQNVGTTAASRAQTAMGRWNKVDSQNKYALLIGNGTSDSARSNALAVTWDGRAALEKDSSTSGFVAEADWLLTSQSYQRCLNVVQANIVVKAYRAIAAGSSRVGTIPSAWKPANVAALDARSTGRRGTIDTSGVITLYTDAAINAGTSVTLSGTYIVPE